MTKIENNEQLNTWLRIKGYPEPKDELNFDRLDNSFTIQKGIVLGVWFDGEYEEDVWDVEFNEGTPENFLLPSRDRRDYTQDRFIPEVGEEVAVLVSADHKFGLIVGKKLTAAQEQHIIDSALERKRVDAEVAERNRVAKQKRRDDAAAFLKNLDDQKIDPMGRLSLQTFGGYSASYDSIYGDIISEQSGMFYRATIIESPVGPIEIPTEFAREFVELLAPRFLKFEEEKKQASRIEYLKKNFTPEQLDEAVAEYKAAQA